MRGSRKQEQKQQREDADHGLAPLSSCDGI
jgi:hypothetical protein